MKKGKFLSCLCVLALLASNLVACSKSSETPETTTSPSGEIVSDTQPESMTVPPPEIPDSDYGGQKFNILCLDWGLYTNYFFAEEETGDSMNDAIYKRTAWVEEQLNIDIVGDKKIYSEHAAALKNMVLSGETTYDLVLTHCIDNLQAMVTEHYLYNWKDIPYADLTKPYWNQSMNENLSVQGVQLFATNDFMIADPNAIFFNKTLLKNYDLEDPYTLVRDGKWTWDKLSEMAKSASKDIDGNSIFDEKDQYGFVGELDWQFVSIMHACDIFVTTKDKEDRPILSLNNEKMINLVQKVYDLLYQDNRSYAYEFNALSKGKPFVPFDSGRALFCLVPLGSAKTYRSTDVDFGILPFPKYDEAQEKYLSTDWSGLMAVPITIKDPELVGKVSELLAYKSSTTTLPAYFDILLTSKIARDSDSNEMLQIIYSNIVYDFGLNFTNYSALLYAIPQLMQRKSTDFASFYAKNEKIVIKSLDKIYEGFLSYKK